MTRCGTNYSFLNSSQIKTPYYPIKVIGHRMLNRSFKVKIVHFISSDRPFKIGVAQGAVLSPALFSIYINDLPICKEENVCDTLLFADDINHNRSYEEKTPMIEQKLNEYLQKLEK